MSEVFKITITAVEPPADGANVTVDYVGGIRTGNFSLAAVADAVQALNRAMRDKHPAQSALETAGSALFMALFNGAVGDAWRDAQTLAREHHTGVRLMLHCELPLLIAVPWEYLYDAPRAQWLALAADLSLVRSLPVTTIAPLSVPGKLRILVMLSAPNDLPQLGGEHEWANLQSAVVSAAIELIRVEPTYEALQGALRQHPPHVFHFIGHGDLVTVPPITAPGTLRHFNLVPESSSTVESHAQGALAFCQTNGTHQLIAADQLAILLGSCTTLRLALLNACQGAVTDTRLAFAGVAQRLIQGGTAAVIAMQAPIYDDHALRFSQEFYRALADGCGVEQAVGEGRRRINEVTWAWGIPSVYFCGAEPFRTAPLAEPEDHAPPPMRVTPPDSGAVIGGNVRT
ncbi:MAG: CHAT domain-containing protein, partial [Caldilineaceae bacterium]|nr:CHAT domain-containing protein [Caldilineaceae bacterium]